MTVSERMSNAGLVPVVVLEKDVYKRQNLRCIIIWKRSVRNLDRNDEGSHFIDEDLAPGCQCRQPGFLFYRIGRKAMT